MSMHKPRETYSGKESSIFSSGLNKKTNTMNFFDENYDYEHYSIEQMRGVPLKEDFPIFIQDMTPVFTLSDGTPLYPAPKITPYFDKKNQRHIQYLKENYDEIKKPFMKVLEQIVNTIEPNNKAIENIRDKMSEKNTRFTQLTILKYKSKDEENEKNTLKIQIQELRNQIKKLDQDQEITRNRFGNILNNLCGDNFTNYKVSNFYNDYKDIIKDISIVSQYSLKYWSTEFKNNIIKEKGKIFDIGKELDTLISTILGYDTIGIEGNDIIKYNLQVANETMKESYQGMRAHHAHLVISIAEKLGDISLGDQISNISTTILNTLNEYMDLEIKKEKDIKDIINYTAFIKLIGSGVLSKQSDFYKFNFENKNENISFIILCLTEDRIKFFLENSSYKNIRKIFELISQEKSLFNLFFKNPEIFTIFSAQPKYIDLFEAELDLGNLKGIENEKDFVERLLSSGFLGKD